MRRELPVRLPVQLKRLVRARGLGAADADDVVQEILIKIASEGGRISESRFWGWVMQVARTTIADHFRGERSLERRARKAALLEPREAPVTPQAEAEDEERENPLLECLPGLLSELPPGERSLLRRIELEGRSQREIARESGIAYSTLKSRVQKARGDLKAAILGCCEVSLDARKRVTSIRSRRGKGCGPRCASRSG